MLTRGSCWSAGSSSNRRRLWQSLIAQSDRPPYLIRSDGSDQLCLTIAIGPSPHLNFNRTAYRIRGRTPRSRSDRTAIAARSNRDRGAYVVEAPPFDQTAIDGDSGSRLTHDRGPIVTQSWPDRGENRGPFLG